MAIDNPYYDDSYWIRLSRLSFFKKIEEENGYHFLHEIQSLSNQIHFGLATCFLLKDSMSSKYDNPNVYNHRYTFMIESIIHGIYAYWNRVALALNTYLKKPKVKIATYFKTVVPQLLIDYPTLEENDNYKWINNANNALEELGRNEFAHNNSLIMQNFLPNTDKEVDFEYLLAMPRLLLSHNKSIL